MKIKSTRLPEVKIVEPAVFKDDRGYFCEIYHKEKFAEQGIKGDFVQDNQSYSLQGTIRGLHYQIEPKAQAKLVKVVKGEIFDVAIDIRPNSPTFGQWVGEYLSEENKKNLYIPGDFAHGFYVTSKEAIIVYKCTNFYSKEHERSIIWNDPTIKIDWPLIPNIKLHISDKDQVAPPLKK